MSYEKILKSPHLTLINKAIEANYSPSVIREGLVREGIDEFSISEIEEYVQHYLQEVLNRSIAEQKEIYQELNSSVPTLMANNLKDDQKQLTYQVLLELDVLRAEKLIQDMIQGKSVPATMNIMYFEKLARIKTNVVTSLTTLLEYKKAIQEAQNAQFQSTRVDLDRITPYLSNLSDNDRSIALDIMNLIAESRTEEVTQFLPEQK